MAQGFSPCSNVLEPRERCALGQGPHPQRWRVGQLGDQWCCFSRELLSAQWAPPAFPGKLLPPPWRDGANARAWQTGLYNAQSPQEDNSTVPFLQLSSSSTSHRLHSCSDRSSAWTLLLQSPSSVSWDLCSVSHSQAEPWFSLCCWRARPEPLIPPTAVTPVAWVS